MENKRYGYQKELASTFSVAVHDPRSVPWENVQHDILATTSSAFAELEDKLNMLYVEKLFSNPDNTIILLRSQDDTICGYTVAKPSWGSTAYISLTAIHQIHQKRGLLPMLLTTLDDTLRAKGYRFVERDARIRHGYADTLMRIYNERVVAHHDWFDFYLNEMKRVITIRL